MKKLLKLFVLSLISVGACGLGSAQAGDYTVDDLTDPSPSDGIVQVIGAVTTTNNVIRSLKWNFADGAALGLASHVPHLREGQKAALSLNSGFYDGGSAIAVGGTLALGETNGQVYGTLGTGLTSRKVGGSAGIQWAW